MEIRIKDEFTTGIELYSLRALLFCNILKIVGVIILSRAVLIV